MLYTTFILTEPFGITIIDILLAPRAISEVHLSKQMSHLVVHSVWRVLIWRPLHDSRLALLTFQRQGSLVRTKGCEFVCRRLIGVRLPVAEPSSSGGVHVTTTVLPCSGKNANKLQNRCYVYKRVIWQKCLWWWCVVQGTYGCCTFSIVSFLVKKATVWKLSLLPSSGRNITQICWVP